MLYHAATVTADPQARLALETVSARSFPNTPRRSRALRRRQAALGKPFDLEFTDAVTGVKVSTRSLKGKILVVDFWATWCALRRRFARDEGDLLQVPW